MSEQLFDPQGPEKSRNPAFESIRTFPGSEPARLMMESAYESFVDSDGNFREQFQTTGFDARVFELFLNTYFVDAAFTIERPSGGPDFILSKAGTRVAIEATTANPTQARSGGVFDGVVAAQPVRHPELPSDAPTEREATELAERIAHEFPIKLGSALYSKLKKRDWEKPVATGMPFILAVEAFHANDSLYFSSAGLTSYLYGIDQSFAKDDDGRLLISNHPLVEHRLGEKAIPSNFFAQPDTEHVSAVMFTNSGTSAKFTRMGYQAGLHRGNVLISRTGFFFDPDPNSPVPIVVSYFMHDPPFAERWGHGVTVFHNPRATMPLARGFFPGATDVYLLGDDVAADVCPYGPYLSRTLIANFTDPTFTPVDLAANGVGTLLVSEFDAFGPARAPHVAEVVREVAWFASKDRTVLGVVTQDRADEDYGFVVLGRDGNGLFRGIDLEINIKEQIEAHRELIRRIERFAASGESVFIQGDEEEE